MKTKKESLNKLLVLFLAGFILAAGLSCTKKISPPPRKDKSETSATAPVLPASEHPTQKKYTVLGQTFTPLSTHDGYTEEGIASWYGPKFHGRKTSNGETFNMYDLTAAHRTLPMNTKVKVTNLENQKVVELRINDRGPFAKNRIIDLSFAAAKAIDMIGPGTVRVRVDAVGSLSRAEMTGNYYVQVGSFSSRKSAEKLMQEMKSAGYQKSRLQEFSRSSERLWRVQAGKFDNLLAAEDARQKLLEKIPGAFIIAD
ncbi:MAG: septal ring lytic transglycosylase RlpA family protein [Desulfonatronovibrio sp.]